MDAKNCCSLLLVLAATNLLLFVSATNQCQHELVESMPDGLDLPDPSGAHVVRTHNSLLEMIENAQKTLRIASFYWILTADKHFEGHPAVLPGKMIMDAIAAAVGRGVNLEVILDQSGKQSMSSEEDLGSLRKMGTLRFLNMTHLLHAGVLHSKFMVADNKTFYIGSSNFDWRSYTEIKEIGITFKNCDTLAQDLDKIFRTYSLISDMGQIPKTLPDYLKTPINIDNPMGLKMGDLKLKVFLAGAPPAFNGVNDWTGRTDDIDGLLHILDNARHRLDISVMNYSPRLVFGWPKKYWPRIDDALRRAAAERGVHVRLLFSEWHSTQPIEIMWYKSLNALQSSQMKPGGIHVKLFKVPAFDDFQKSIPYARVKHDKYMVTDSGLYIGTSNWTPDYFLNTCGVGVVIEPESKHDPSLNSSSSIIKNMQDIFERDFNSQYAHELP